MSQKLHPVTFGQAVRRMLAVNCEHLHPIDDCRLKYLDDQCRGDESCGPVTFAFTPLGLLVDCITVPDEAEFLDAAFTNSLRILMLEARAQQCDYLLIDIHGPFIDGLPTYDWG